jgi:hypothetical protein
METLLESAHTFIQNIDWRSPSSFVIIAVALLAVTGRW